MSKNKKSTREKILDKALEMFNERGIEYVGLRELAAVLGIRVGNITYYFPTKDELVYQLSLELRKANSLVMVDRENLSMAGFLEMLHQLFQNHIRFRCLLLSFVHLMAQNKLVAESYKQTQVVRGATLGANLGVLAAACYLHLPGKGDAGFLVSALALINRFWISEAAVSLPQLEPRMQARHYLLLITKLLAPYATDKGRLEIEGFVEKLEG